MPSPQKIKCLVKTITDHSNQVYSLDLLPEKRIPRFRSGQFLHLAIDEYDPSKFWPDSRVFSIASASRNSRLIRITYSVKGKFTTRMENELKEGMTVWVKMPYGDFVIDEMEEAVLMAGGTGITAFTAFLEQLDFNSAGNVLLVYGARTPELLIYSNFVENIARLHNNLRVIYFVEKMLDSDIRRGVEMIHGIISVDQILPFIQNKDASTFYLSGPPVMIDSLRAQLQKENVGPNQIKIDAWE